MNWKNLVRPESFKLLHKVRVLQSGAEKLKDTSYWPFVLRGTLQQIISLKSRLTPTGVALQAFFCVANCALGSPPRPQHCLGWDVPTSCLPAMPSCSSSHSMQLSMLRWKCFQQDCECERPQSKPQRWLLLLGDSNLRWALSGELHFICPWGHLDLTCPVSSSTKLYLALGSHITCCSASPESSLHLLWAGIPGTASQSCFCSDNLKPGVPSFVMLGSPWGPRLSRRGSAVLSGTALVTLEPWAARPKEPSLEAWPLCSLGWVGDRWDLGCCIAAEAPQGRGKHIIDPATSQLVSALHYFLTSSHFKLPQWHKHID